MPATPTFITLLFLGIVLFCALFLVFSLRKALRNHGASPARINEALGFTSLGIALWLGLQAMLAQSGFFDFSALPPRIPLVLLPPAIFAYWLSRKSWFQQLLLSLPPKLLIWPQAMRIAVEIVLWQSFIAGLIPKQMTFEGINFDILSGIWAVIISIIIKAEIKLVYRVYNYSGLLFLFLIVMIANLSAPTPLQVFKEGPAPAIIGEFPFVWLPGFIVPFAFALHVWSLKQLRLRSEL